VDLLHQIGDLLLDSSNWWISSRGAPLDPTLVELAQITHHCHWLHKNNDSIRSVLCLPRREHPFPLASSRLAVARAGAPPTTAPAGAPPMTIAGQSDAHDRRAL
jgi:hypothetical protein